MTADGLEVRQSSASVWNSKTELRNLRVVSKLIDTSTCIGCKACEVACQEWNDLHIVPTEQRGTYQTMPTLHANYWNLIQFREREIGPDFAWLLRKDGCMHCADPGCLKACPAPGAIVQYTNGIVDFVHENCIGCGYCVKGCPFNIPRISKVDHKAYKCTLCSDRVAIGQGPACAKACPTQAIVFGTKEDMKKHADARIKDLKSRGYKNAGLYDPPGVGGTHVMYVLHHADKPEIYARLPKDPKISPLVEAWKGVAKYAGLFAMGAIALVGVLHHLVAGPNKVAPEDEENAKRLAGS